MNFPYNLGMKRVYGVVIFKGGEIKRDRRRIRRLFENDGSAFFRVAKGNKRRPIC